MDLISVIVPIYNVERYVKRCVHSLINQTYANIEIILVNDGSTDKSLELCNRLAKRDSRIKVIDKPNEGVSVARNTGIINARGDYICFVDSDDFLPKRSIEYLYNEIVSSDVDMSIGCWSMISPKGASTNHYDSKIILRGNKQDMMHALVLPEMKGPVAKLYKTTIIKDNSLVFPRDIKVSEDTIFVYDYIKHCEKISLIDKNVYYYNRLSIDSATTKYYADFNKATFRCLKGYIENIVDEKTTIKNLIVQQKITNDFIAVKNYYLHFAMDSKDVVVAKIRETYKLFEPYIQIDVIKNNAELFQDFLTSLSSIDNNIENIFANNISSNLTKRKKIKRFILNIVIKLKTFLIFDLGLGYKN